MSRTIRIATSVAVLATALPAAFTATATAAEEAKSFHRVSTFPVFKNAPAGVPASDPTVAEISTVSEDGKTLIYTDALGKRIGFLDISDPADPKGAGSLSLASLGAEHDEPTSVAVVGKYVLVVVDTSTSFTNPSGRLDIVRINDGVRVRSLDLQGQPDSIAVSVKNKVAAIAIENQRDEEFKPAGLKKGDLPQAPAGFVQLLDLEGANPAGWNLRRVDLVNSDGSALPSMVAAGIDSPTDPEPEYVTINSAGKLALTLQENNGIVLIDTATGAIDKVFSAGSVDLTGIDAKKDGIIDPVDSLSAVPREPDSIAWVNDTHLATANEGDWKGGSRGWTIFDANGAVVWDAGNTFERLAIKHGLYNDDRAAKKGSEPEGLTFAEFDGRPYVFVGSERSNFIAVYEVSNPAAPKFIQIMPATNGPEGLLAIPERGLFAVSSETDDAAKGVRASVGLYEFKPGQAQPTAIEADEVDGKPIGWQALGALSADPSSATTLWTAADTVVKNGTLFKLDVSATPARITAELPVTENGESAPLDIEGVFKRPQGGFWLASEGATGDKNVLVRTDDAGAIQERVTLPADIAAKVKNWGLEGVTATTDAGGEHVWFVMQRPLWSNLSTLEDFEGENITRIGRYDVNDQKFHWYGYQLQAPQRGSGDWVGLSEITAINDHTFVVIERDKLNGPAARNKRIYTVSVPTANGKVTDPSTSELPILTKKLAIDVLPQLKATNGWTQEKLEGFTISTDGKLYGVTDNDGLKDATGETVFLRMGTAAKAFSQELATTTELSLSGSKVPFAGNATATVTVSGATAGTVELLAGTKVLASAQVTGSKATIKLPQLAVGRHALTAKFTGGALAAESTSSVVSVDVVKAASKSTIKSSAKKVKAGKKVTLTANVTAVGHQPTGKIQFVQGKRVLKTVSLSGGKASAKVRLSKKGNAKIRAIYVGSAQTAASKSTTINIRVR